MPVPDILDLDPASDVRFRDVYGRHHNRTMSRSGNLIRTLYHHVSGAQANVSAAEIVSLDNNENAQYDLLLRNSTAPLNSANLTNANIATWSESSLLSIRQGTTSIRSGNVSVGNVIVGANATAQLDNSIVRSFQKSLGEGVGNASEICTITQFASAYAAELNIVQSQATAWFSKHFKFVAFYNLTANAWKRLVPMSSSTNNSQEWGVEIRINNNVTTLRLVRLSGSTTANIECLLTVYQSRPHPVIIAESTTTATGVTFSTSLYDNANMTQVAGNVGIGTDNPSYPLDVTGIARAQKYWIVESFTGTPGLPQGAYISWNTRGGDTRETSFLNKSGSGAGGFYFYNSSGSGSSTEFNNNTQIASITPSGITIPSGSFIAPGSIIGSLFSTGKDLTTSIPDSTYNRTTYTTWATEYTFTYTPKSNSSRLFMYYDAEYTIGGFGADTFKSRITVDNVEVAYKQQDFRSNLGSGTRSNVIFPISAIFKNTSTAQKTIRIQVFVNDSDDTLTISSANWLFKLLERKT